MLNSFRLNVILSTHAAVTPKFSTFYNYECLPFWRFKVWWALLMLLASCRCAYLLGSWSVCSVVLNDYQQYDGVNDSRV